MRALLLVATLLFTFTMSGNAQIEDDIVAEATDTLDFCDVLRELVQDYPQDFSNTSAISDVFEDEDGTTVFYEPLLYFPTATASDVLEDNTGKMLYDADFYRDTSKILAINLFNSILADMEGCDLQPLTFEKVMERGDETKDDFFSHATWRFSDPNHVLAPEYEKLTIVLSLLVYTNVREQYIYSVGINVGSK